MTLTQKPKTKKPWNKRGNGYEGSWDAIVIGSGMGGMTAAAILAKAGKRVLVLEQHYVPGGFTHMFKRKGYTWDVGVHLVGEVTEHTWTGRLLSYLSDGELEWASMGELYEEFYYPDFEIKFPGHPKKLKKTMLRAFPEEKEAIDAYFALIQRASDAMGMHFAARLFSGLSGKMADAVLGRKARPFLQQSVTEVLEGLTNNPKLRAIFSAQWGYYGTPPSQTSFGMQAVVSRHYLYGGYYPVGGAKRIAECLLATVAEAGGWTRISTSAEEILLEKGRAVGVRLDNGEEVRADCVISAAGLQPTAKRLLPTSYQQAPWVTETQALPSGPAHVCLYIGFKGDITKAGAGSANKWFNASWEADTAQWDVSSEGELEEIPCLYCSFPSLKDPAHDPGQELRHTGEAVTFVPWEAFRPWMGTSWKKRGEKYQAFKEKLTNAILEKLLAHMPELRDMVDYVELSTPLSTDTFCRPIQGSIYGLAPTPARFQNRWLRPKTPIPGLYLSGCDVISAGVMGAMMGGVFAATAVAPLSATKIHAKVALTTP